MGKAAWTRFHNYLKEKTRFVHIYNFWTERRSGDNYFDPFILVTLDALINILYLLRD